MKRMINVLVLTCCVIVAMCGIYAMMLSDKKEFKELKEDEIKESNSKIDSTVNTIQKDEDLDNEMKYKNWLNYEEKENR